MGKPTYRPRNKRRIKTHGFRARMETKWGRAGTEPPPEEGAEAPDRSDPEQVRRRVTRASAFRVGNRLTRSLEITDRHSRGEANSDHAPRCARPRFPSRVSARRDRGAASQALCRRPQPPQAAAARARRVLELLPVAPAAARARRGDPRSRARRMRPTSARCEPTCCRFMLVSPTARPTT